MSYCVLMVLGAFGVWLSMPVFFRPQSTIEWIDLAINIVIFVPSSFVAVVGGLLAILCAAFAYRPDADNRCVALAYGIARLFGFSEQFVRQVVALSPLGLWRAVFADSDPGGAPPDAES